MKRQPPFEPNFAGPVDGIYNADPDAPYVNGNPATGEEGSIPPFESVDHPQRELVHLIAHAGLTPSHEDLEQVRKAVKKMIEDGTLSNPITGDAVAVWEGLDPVSRHHKIRALKAGANVSIELVEEPAASGNYQIVISAAGGGGEGGGGGGGGGGGEGDPLTLENIGAGAQVYKETVDGSAKLRTVKGVNGIGVTQSTNEIVVDGAVFGQFMPFFPEIETADNRLAITPSTGQVVVAGDQTFIHRGVRRVNTTATLVAARTFATTVSKIYHLRWRWNAGVPAYVLKDLADPSYNPGAAAETSPIFDSTYDDMLIARVVTSAGNVPTVTALKNKHQLLLQSKKTGLAGNRNEYVFFIEDTFNWSRTPTWLNSWTLQAKNSYSDDDMILDPDHPAGGYVTRYAYRFPAMNDFCDEYTTRTLLTA